MGKVICRCQLEAFERHFLAHGRGGRIFFNAKKCIKNFFDRLWRSFIRNDKSIVRILATILTDLCQFGAFAFQRIPNGIC